MFISSYDNDGCILPRLRLNFNDYDTQINTSVGLTCPLVNMKSFPALLPGHKKLNNQPISDTGPSSPKSCTVNQHFSFSKQLSIMGSRDQITRTFDD